MYFTRSIGIVNSYWYFVPLMALSGIYIFSDSGELYSFLLLMISFIIAPVVYGQLIDTVRNRRTASWFNLFLLHVGNYFLLSAILVLIFILLSNLFPPGTDSLRGVIMANLLGAFLHTATVYILPLLFLNRRVFPSIYRGIMTLIDMFWQSIPLILITLLIAILRIIATTTVDFLGRTNSAVIGIFFFQNIISGYLYLLLFVTATLLLLEQKRDLIDE